MTDGDFNYFSRRAASDKLLRDLTLIKIHNMENINMELLHWFINFLDENSAATRKGKRNNYDVVSENQKLVEKIRKFGKQNVHSSVKDNFWGVDLADILPTSRCNEEFQFLLFVIDILSKYAWGFLLKDKKGITIANAFLKKSFR